MNELEVYTWSHDDAFCLQIDSMEPFLSSSPLDEILGNPSDHCIITEIHNISERNYLVNGYIEGGTDPLAYWFILVHYDSGMLSTTRTVFYADDQGIQNSFGDTDITMDHTWDQFDWGM
jgi:hypothetical protein